MGVKPARFPCSSPSAGGAQTAAKLPGLHWWLQLLPLLPFFLFNVDTTKTPWLNPGRAARVRDEGGSETFIKPPWINTAGRKWVIMSWQWAKVSSSLFIHKLINFQNKWLKRDILIQEGSFYFCNTDKQNDPDVVFSSFSWKPSK